MGSFIRDFHANEDPITPERWYGLEPASLDAEHDRHLHQLDRINDFTPASAALRGMTPLTASPNPGRPHSPADGRDPHGA